MTPYLIFDASQLEKEFGSEFVISTTYSDFLCLAKMLMSSAKSMQSALFKVLWRSFTYRIKNGGPRIVLWGTTPSLLESFIATNCLQLLK